MTNADLLLTAVDDNRDKLNIYASFGHLRIRNIVTGYSLDMKTPITKTQDPDGLRVIESTPDNHEWVYHMRSLDDETVHHMIEQLGLEPATELRHFDDNYDWDPHWPYEFAKQPEPVPADSAIARFRSLLQKSEHTVFLTGAGVSTDSGIPDFRSNEGLYNTVTTPLVFNKWVFRIWPGFFYSTMGPMYAGIARAVPNMAHKAIAELEKQGKDVTVITQNIDGLHQAAGSSKVLEVHGTMDTMTCRKCGKQVSTESYAETIESGLVPHCDCGGVLKPDLVFFGDELPGETMRKAALAMLSADLVVVMGTSLKVSTANKLLALHVEGTPIVIINQQPTDWDDVATIVFHDSISEVAKHMVE